MEKAGVDDDEDDEEDTFQPDAADQEEEQEDEDLEDEGDVFDDEDEDEDEGDSENDLERVSLARSTPKGRRLPPHLRKPISTAAAAEIAASGIATGKSPTRKQTNLFRKSGATKRVHATGISVPNLDRLRKKGVERSVRGFGQENRLKDLFGPDHENLVPVIETRERWKHQEALPSREDGSLGRSYHISEDARLKEIEGFRQWYCKSGADSFRKGQKNKTLSKENGLIYLKNEGPERLNTLMGPMPEPSTLR